jgi:baseplate upper protein BppU
MAIKNFYIQLDLQETYDQRQFEVFMEDTLGNKVNIYLTQHGAPYDLTDVEYVKITVLKSDDNESVSFMVIDDADAGAISHIFSAQDLAAVGIARVTVGVYRYVGEVLTRVTSSEFVFLVKEDLEQQGQGIESSADYPVLTDLIDQVDNLSHEGDYAAETTYDPLNIVTYLGGSYMCILESTGNLPTNDTYWRKIAEKGDKGDTGTPGDGITGSSFYLGNYRIYHDSGTDELVVEYIG